MGTRFNSLTKLLVVAASSVMLAGTLARAAAAQDIPYDETIPAEFNRTFFRNDDGYWGNNRFPRSVTWFLGLPEFPENEIGLTGHKLHNLYNETLWQQVANDPTIRTPDLPNPFSGSLLTTPLVSEEEPIPPAPFAPPPRQPAPPAATTGPVRGMW